MPFCQYCGSQLNETDKFCCICGKPVIIQPPVGNNINPGQNFNQNSFNPQPGNPPVFSQQQGMQSQPMQQGYPQQTMQQGFSQPQSPQSGFPQQNYQPHTQYGSNSFPQGSGIQNDAANVNYYSTPPTDEFHRKVWEYAKERGWIDQEQSGSEDIWLNINGNYYVYPVLTNDGTPGKTFTLLKGVTEFKKKHTDIIIQLILIESVSSYISRLSMESQQLGLLKSLNQVTLICNLPKELISDVSLAFDIALKDMNEVETNFMADYNNLINQ